jgi:WD40 repeat protein
MRIFVFLLLSPVLLADEPRLVIDSGGHQATIMFVAFTRDGKYLVSAGVDKVVRIWDLASGKTIRAIRGQDDDGPVGMIYAVALSPDERYIAVGGSLDTSSNAEVIRVHDFHNGEVVALLNGHTNVVNSLAFSRDGRYIASGSSDGTVRVWDVDARKSVFSLSGHQDAVEAVAFSPDGQRLVSGSRDKTLRLWELSSGKLLKEMTGHRGRVRSAIFSPDGRYIASGGVDRSIRLWNGKTGKFVKDLARQASLVTGLSFSPDGRTLLTGAGDGDLTCHVFEVPSGRTIASFSAHKNIVPATAFSPDGKLVATAGGNQHEIYLWYPTNSKIVRELVGAGQRVWSVGFAADGKSVAFGGTWKQHDDNNHGPLERTILLGLNQEDGVGLGVSLPAEEQFVRAQNRAGDVTIRVKQGEVYETNALQILRSGKVFHEIPRDSGSGYGHGAYSLSPDGAMIASGGGGGVLTLYAAGTGEPAASCVGHTSEVWAVAFSADGKTLVSGSGDQTVRLWDASPTACRNLLTVFVGTDNEWVAWTPQGYYTASANGDKYIGWHVNQGLDHQAKFYGAAQFQKQFYRPDAVAEFLISRNIDVAVKTANKRRGGERHTEKTLGPVDVARNPPPVIAIAEPFDNEVTTTESTYHVRAVAASTVPVSGFEVFVNGVSAGRTNAGRLEADVPLQPGQNKLSFIASNAKTSQTETRLVTYKGTGKMEKPKLILLAVGVSKYEHPRFKLDWADQDAIAIEQAFLSQNGILYSNVVPRHLVNSDATKDNILDALKWLNEEGSDDDIRMVFLSGHGGLSYGNYYFYTVNHDPAKDPESRDVRWEALLERLTSPRRKAVLMVDSCHAAAATSGVRERGEVDFEQVLREMKSKFRGLFTLSASMGTEQSLESKEWQHGAFTRALLDAMQNAAAQGKVLSTDDITKEVKDRVKNLTKDEQHPRETYSETLTGFPLFQVRGRGRIQ